MRKCALDLAPEAPWHCPADCTGYEPRRADVNWRHGTLITPSTPEPPSSVGEDPSIAALLDSAEDIINNAGPEIREQVDIEREREQRRNRKRPRWWPFG